MTAVLLISLSAFAFTLLMLWLLGATDPKRSRLSAGNWDAPSRLPRGLLTLLAILPGVLLLLSGQTAAFLIWLGGASVAGWGIVHLLPRPG